MRVPGGSSTKLSSCGSSTKLSSWLKVESLIQTLSSFLVRSVVPLLTIRTMFQVAKRERERERERESKF